MKRRGQVERAVKDTEELRAQVASTNVTQSMNTGRWLLRLGLEQYLPYFEREQVSVLAW